jgi:uncharacterized protein (DUF305 family)
MAIAIIGLGVATYILTTQRTDTDNPMPMSNSVNESSTEKSETERMYETYVGEDYDRYFIANMIAHHQGAIDMAKLGQVNAGRQEIKDMSADIVAAQEKEVTDMTAWQQKWGYPSSSGEMMMDHSAMGMMDDMASMTDALKGLSGTAFDKKFIELMIEHHQSAIDMAKPGEKNAYHQEVKDLTRAIIEAQSGEIAQMKQWQKDWGFTQ